LVDEGEQDQLILDQTLVSVESTIKDAVGVAQVPDRLAKLHQAPQGTIVLRAWESLEDREEA
jgi:hypothetical protein